jgi:acyl-coenzyme A synthetase/AMP-(fatty) acid ligase
MKEKTEDVKITLSDGREWFDTNDRGYFRPNHFLQITGRDFRVITNSDFKLSLDAIQDKLLSLGNFREVAVVPLEKGPDEFPVLFAKLKTDHNNMSLDEVNTRIQSILGPYEMPIKIVLVDKLPSLPSGKIDYLTIEKIVKKLPDMPSCRAEFDLLSKEAEVEIEKGPELKLTPRK